MQHSIRKPRYGMKPMQGIGIAVDTTPNCKNLRAAKSKIEPIKYSEAEMNAEITQKMTIRDPINKGYRHPDMESIQGIGIAVDTTLNCKLTSCKK